MRVARTEAAQPNPEHDAACFHCQHSPRRERTVSTSPPPTMTSQAPRPPRKRLRRILVLAILGAVAATAAVVGYFIRQSYLSEQALAEAIAETDRLDPGWRLMELEASRKPVPPEEDSAALVARTATGAWTILNAGNRPALNSVANRWTPCIRRSRSRRSRRRRCGMPSSRWRRCWHRRKKWRSCGTGAFRATCGRSSTGPLPTWTTPPPTHGCCNATRTCASRTRMAMARGRIAWPSSTLAVPWVTNRCKLCSRGAAPLWHRRSA